MGKRRERKPEKKKEGNALKRKRNKDEGKKREEKMKGKIK